MGVCLVLGVQGSCCWLEKKVEGLGWGMGWLGNSLVPAAGCLLGRQLMGQLGAGAGAACRQKGGGRGGLQMEPGCYQQESSPKRPCSLPPMALAAINNVSDKGLYSRYVNAQQRTTASLTLCGCH